MSKRLVGLRKPHVFAITKSKISPLPTWLLIICSYRSLFLYYNTMCMFNWLGWKGFLVIFKHNPCYQGYQGSHREQRKLMWGTWQGVFLTRYIPNYFDQPNLKSNCKSIYKICVYPLFYIILLSIVTYLNSLLYFLFLITFLWLE